MFKIQYPTDHLKKEGVSSKITELSDEIQYVEQVKEFSKRYRRSDDDTEDKVKLIYQNPSFDTLSQDSEDDGSRFIKVDVPGDGSCLFWSVTMAYLIPVRNDDALFQQRKV